MPTVNLGRVRMKWRGTWAGSTAYAKDDIVRYGVDSYICTTAHTSDASTFTNDSANWELMNQGAEIPSQTGNANSYLQTDGTNLSWTAVQSDYVKLTESYGGNTSALNFPTIFSDNNQYRRFQVYVEVQPVQGTNFHMRFSDSAGTFIGTSGYYDYTAHAAYGGATAGNTLTNSRGNSEFRLHDFSLGADATSRFSIIIANVGPNETDLEAGYTGYYFLEEGSNNYQVTGAIGGNIRRTGECNGLQFFMAAGNMNKHRIAIYGIR